MEPSVGNGNEVLQNQNISATQTTKKQVHVDVPSPSQLRTKQFPIEGIREKVQRRVRLAREQEVQREVDLILEIDRLVREE
ncbi:hypothetical protein LIER_25319 [Lithospermum erythrorhizon]|uniref:Uncharacterized protein n=1 Tax=Lithospermum erythrorhizon TaxID=34254 RepID=A0AAV3R4G2_LITER